MGLTFSPWHVNRPSRQDCSLPVSQGGRLACIRDSATSAGNMPLTTVDARRRRMRMLLARRLAQSLMLTLVPCASGVPDSVALPDTTMPLKIFIIQTKPSRCSCGPFRAMIYLSRSSTNSNPGRSPASGFQQC